jgi:hypothetical protein
MEMTTATKIAKSMTHAVVYVGAPYGLNEGGHIVSLHRSEEAAAKHCDSYAGQMVVALDEEYRRGYPGQTAREYFNA